MEKKKLTDGLQARLLVWIVAVLSILSFLLPFGHYKSGKVMTVSGFRFLTGTTLLSSKGKVVTTVDPVVPLIIALAFIVLAAIIVVFYGTLNKKVVGLAVGICGAAALICSVVFIIGIGGTMDGAKKTGMSWGLIIFLLTGVLMLACGLRILYVNKVLVMLDFMVVPGFAYLLINNYLPMIGISLAFKKINFTIGIWKSPWCGFDNFKFLFQSSDAWVITRNTLAYNIVFIILGIVVGVIVGICLSEVWFKWFQRVSQTLILLPQLISMVIVSYIVYGFLSSSSGWVNNAIFHEQNHINFYATRKYWPFILTFVQVWKQLGYNSIIYLSSIVGIDRSLYEAAYIDGCSKIQQIFKITLPLLKPTIMTLFIMSCGRIMYSDFGLFYQVTQTIDTYVYRALMKLNNLSMASAASAFQSVLGFILVMAVNLITRKLDKENALF